MNELVREYDNIREVVSRICKGCRIYGEEAEQRGSKAGEHGPHTAAIASRCCCTRASGGRL